MKRTFLIPLFLLIWAANSDAQIPRTISYQGDLRTSSGSTVPDGAHSITLSVYNVPSGGNPLYREIQSVNVVKGIFTCIIGSSNPIPDWLTFDSAYYLGVAIDQDIELSPRTLFTSVPYALHAQIADGLTANAFIPPGLIVGTAAPSGPALGDLSGTFPYPQVIGLQTRPISTLPPQQGDVFMWNGGTWGPQPEPHPIAFHVSGDSSFPDPSNKYHNIIKFSLNSGNGLFDDGGFFDTTSSSFPIPKTGVYRFDMHASGTVLYANYYTIAYAHISIAITIDGKIIGQQDFDPPLDYVYSSTSFENIEYATLLKLTAGQLVKILIWANSDPVLSGVSADLSVFKLN